MNTGSVILLVCGVLSVVALYFFVSWMVQENKKKYGEKDRFALAMTLSAITLFAALIFIIAGFSIYGDQRSCVNAGNKYDRPTKFQFFYGCYIQANYHQWVTLDQYRVIVQQETPLPDPKP